MSSRGSRQTEHSRGCHMHDQTGDKKQERESLCKKQKSEDLHWQMRRDQSQLLPLLPRNGDPFLIWGCYSPCLKRESIALESEEEKRCQTVGEENVRTKRIWERVLEKCQVGLKFRYQNWLNGIKCFAFRNRVVSSRQAGSADGLCPFLWLGSWWSFPAGKLGIMERQQRATTHRLICPTDNEINSNPSLHLSIAITHDPGDTRKPLCVICLCNRDGIHQDRDSSLTGLNYTRSRRWFW